MLPKFKEVIWIVFLLSLSVLMMSGAMFQDEMPQAAVTPMLATPTSQIPVATCIDCYYREPTAEELAFAERIWQEAWGHMSLHECLEGVVLEPIEE